MLLSWWDALREVEPALVWGLFTRGLGVIYAISFLSLAPQTLMAAGTRGAIPVARRLERMREDFPAPLRYVYFPTLLWLSSRDVVLRIVPLIGLCAALCVIYGGPLGTAGLVVCYLCYLTLDMPIGLIFPWDCLLFEATILGLFLPQTLPLPELAATAAPAPAIAWAYRILLLRVMLGFGKQKFIGSTNKDMGYLRGFLTAQTLPSPLGWYAQKLPLPLLKGMLVFMFFAEIPVPIMGLFPGDASLIAAIATMGLMVGIMAFGSFGYFSPLTMIVCITLLDNETPRALDLGGYFSANGPLLTNSFVLAHTILGILLFPLNSWVAQSYSHWTVFLRLRPRILAWPATILRWLHPFRVVHPYGVFPPKAFPAEKTGLLVEVSWDGTTWHECSFPHFVNSEQSRPKFIAPHHPRGDQAVIYESYGLNPNTMISALAGPFDPYPYGMQPAALILCQHILEGHGAWFIQGEELSRHAEPPKLARLRTIMMQPASLEELRREGKYWRRRVIGPHTPDRELDPDFWRYLMPEPDLWHPEAYIWRRRSTLRKLMDRAERGEPFDTAVIADTPELTTADVERFWKEFIPSFSREEREQWDSLPKVVARVRASYDRHELRVLERLLGRLSAMLEARLVPLYLGRGLSPQELPAKNYLDFYLLIQHIIAKGRDAFAETLAKPELAKTHLEDFTLQNGSYLLSVFHFDTWAFDAQKLRLIRAVLGPYQDRTPQEDKLVEIFNGWFGWTRLAEAMMLHFKGPEYDGGYPERYPSFHVAESGEVVMTSWGDEDEPAARSTDPTTA